MICTTYVIDKQRQLGQGQAVFQAARHALLAWRMFDLGWVSVLDANGQNAQAPPQVGQAYTIATRWAGLRFLSQCRWRRIWDEPASNTPAGGGKFTLCCQTLSQHPLEGEEYFRLTLHPQTGAVWYSIRSCSRVKPRYRVAAPLIRRIQQRFVRDSFRAMEQL